MGIVRVNVISTTLDGMVNVLDKAELHLPMYDKEKGIGKNEVKLPGEDEMLI